MIPSFMNVTMTLTNHTKEQISRFSLEDFAKGGLIGKPGGSGGIL